jgi:hypothetical protein
MTRSSTGLGYALFGYGSDMSDEQELTEAARRSREETQQLREESGLGRDGEPGPPAPDSPLPEEAPNEPWAKTSSGDTDELVDDSD